MTEEELREEIIKKEKLLTDFIRLADIIGLNEEERIKRIDLFLDDINKLKRKINNE